MAAVTKVETLEAYRVRLRFDDGSERVVDSPTCSGGRWPSRYATPPTV